MQIFYCFDQHHGGKTYTRKLTGDDEWSEWDYNIHNSDLSKKVFLKDDWAFDFKEWNEVGPEQIYIKFSYVMPYGAFDTGKKLKAYFVRCRVDRYTPLELRFMDLQEIYHFQVTQDFNNKRDNPADIRAWLPDDEFVQGNLHVSSSLNATHVMVMVIGKMQ